MYSCACRFVCVGVGGRELYELRGMGGLFDSRVSSVLCIGQYNSRKSFPFQLTTIETLR